MNKLLNDIIDLTTEFPNDMELGKGVRNLIHEYRAELDAEWERLRLAKLSEPFKGWDEEDDITG